MFNKGYLTHSSKDFVKDLSRRKIKAKAASGRAGGFSWKHKEFGQL
jgi:hypothetical protein